MTETFEEAMKAIKEEQAEKHRQEGRMEVVKEIKKIWLSFPNNTTCLNKIKEYLVKMEENK